MIILNIYDKASVLELFTLIINAILNNWESKTNLIYALELQSDLSVK